MRFALLGPGPTALSLAAAVSSRPEHTLSHVLMADDRLPEVLKLSPAARVVSSWDDLLADTGLDAVIVDGHDPEIVQAAKQLAHAGRSLLVVPRAVHGSTWIYELTLIRDATGAALVPVLPRRWLPEINQLRELLQTGRSGQLLHLKLDRELPCRAGSPSPPLVSTEAADEEMLADVDVLRSLGGEFNRVTTFYSGRTGDAVSMSTANLAGERPPEAVWSVKAVAAAACWKLTATGEKGVIRLIGSPGAPTRFEAEGIDLPPMPVSPARDAAHRILEQYEEFRSGRKIRPDWEDLTRAIEIVEAAHESVRRRRTIDLHFDTTSERGVFKSQMTALGCGVLALTVVGVVMLLIAGRLLDVRDATQVAAEQADAVVAHEAFVPNTAELTADAENHLAAVAASAAVRDFPVLVEKGDDPADGELDRQRRLSVIRTLEASGVQNADHRTQLGSVRGTWLHPFLRAARFVVFLPVFLFLVFQLLLFLARPSGAQRQTNASSDTS